MKKNNLKKKKKSSLEETVETYKSIQTTLGYTVDV